MELPPASDVACYEGADGRSVCDVDLRPHMLASLVNPGREMPDYKVGDLRMWLQLMWLQ